MGRLDHVANDSVPQDGTRRLIHEAVAKLETSTSRITAAEEAVVPMDVHHEIATRTMGIRGKYLHAQPVQQDTEVVALEGLLLAINGYGKERVISAA